MLDSGRLSPEREERVNATADKYEQNIIRQNFGYGKAVTAYTQGNKATLRRIQSRRYPTAAYRDGEDVGYVGNTNG